MNAIEETSQRLERKFFIPDISVQIIENYIRLNCARFSPIYEPRQINNIYFDTPELDNYVSSCEGISSRVKIRIRWYGALLGVIEKPVLELKFKDNLYVKKKLFPMAPFELDGGLKVSAVYSALKKTKMPWLIKANLISLRPVLLNSYQRKYHPNTPRRQ